MFKDLKNMFGLAKASTRKPDAITVMVNETVERNKEAGQNLRNLLNEMLEENDKNKGLRL
jgi:hypothetical protein